MGAKIELIECPSCHKSVVTGQPDPWCPNCREIFSERFLSSHPEIYKPRPQTEPTTEGINDDTFSTTIAYLLLGFGTLILIIPFFWHPNYSTEYGVIRMLPFSFASFFYAQKRLSQAKRKSRGPSSVA